MQKGLFAAASPITQFILTVLIMLVCAMLFTFIGMFVAIPLFDLSPNDLLTSFTVDAANINALRYLQIIQNISMFIIPALFAGYLFSGSAVRYFDLKYFSQGKLYLIILLIVLCAIPAVNLLASLNEMIVFPKSLTWLENQFKTSEEAAKRITEMFLNVDNIGGVLLNIFMVALLPAIGEELIFRGVFQKILIKWTGSVHAGIIIAGFLFSFMHMQFYGFFPRWLLGAIFGYMMIWSGSIWLPIAAHFVNNALATITTYLINKGHIPEEISTYGSTWSMLPVTILTAAACVFLLWKMRRIGDRRLTADAVINE